MRIFAEAFVLLWACSFCGAQDKPLPQDAPTSEPTSVTVPAAIDHNRVVINADVSLPNGSTQRIRVWVDNGDPELNLSRHMATLLGLAVSCNDHECTSPPPQEIVVGCMSIPLTGMKEAKIPLKPVDAASVLVPGISAEINLPSSILRHY